MKRKISVLLAALLLCGLLGGCGALQAAAGMQLTPVELSEEQTELLALANVDLNQTAFALYAYQADENLHAISFSRYILNDALEWEPVNEYQARMFDEAPLSPSGRISLTEEAGKSFTVNIRADGATYRYGAPDLPDGLPQITAHGFGSQSGPAGIVYGEEIPLLVRTFRDKSELYVYDAARDYIDPSRFEGDLYTEANTVTFTYTVPT